MFQYQDIDFDAPFLSIQCMMIMKGLQLLHLQKNLRTPRSGGTTTLVHDFIDSYEFQPHLNYTYGSTKVGESRVRRAPDMYL